MDVKAHKQQAQALEKKGQTAKAIAAYRAVLDHLEGSKDLLRELPLFVKVGDLCLKEDDKKTALAMYDQAGQVYAEYGSGKSIIAICMKILKVLPDAVNTHVHYARLLLDGEHIAEARKVLVNYAERFDLPKVQRALEAMEGRSKSEMTTMLEMVLEMADLGMPVAESESDIDLFEIAELDVEPEDEEVPDMDGFEIAKGMTDELEERPVARNSIVTGDIASEVDESDSAESEGTAPSDGDGFVVKSGEDWEIEESSVVVDGGEKGVAIAKPEIPTADVPPPTAVPAASDVPNTGLGPPGDDKLMTMEGLVSLGDQTSDDLPVQRFSDSQQTESVQPPQPRPSAPTPVPRRGFRCRHVFPWLTAVHQRRSDHPGAGDIGNRSKASADSRP